jgi:signal transduction histidine kinase
MILFASIFVIEGFIMFIFSHFEISLTPLNSFLDTMILVSFLFPIIYTILYRPLKKSQQLAEENLKNRTLFFAKMTHEIRSPLNVILGISDFLYQEQAANSEFKQYYQANRINRFLN